MGCWDTKPKTEEELKAQAEAMLKHPLYIKLFKIPETTSTDVLKELDEPVDYLKLIE